jgi:hypothetical protein
MEVILQFANTLQHGGANITFAQAAQRADSALCISYIVVFKGKFRIHPARNRDNFAFGTAVAISTGSIERL